MLTILINGPFQTNFAVQTDDQIIANSLGMSYGQYATQGEISDEAVVIDIRKHGTHHCVTCSGRIVHTQTPLIEVESIMYDLRQYSPEVFALHGGAVEHNGGAVLLLAPSTTGKTTLTAYLTYLGFGYITDDCILLDRKSFDVHTFVAPVHLREGGFGVLKSLGAEPKEYQLYGDAEEQRRVFTPVNCVDEPLPLKRIFFIERSEHQNCIQKMNTTEKTIELLKSPITNYEMTAEYLAFISRLAKVPCSRLIYCDMNYVADMIKNDIY